MQINQGSLSTQSFAQGHYCNGPVISIAPYYLQTETVTSASMASRNFGGQISISIPLDGGSVELCKQLARSRIEKNRLDYELVRIKECISILQTGFRIKPGTPMYPICADVEASPNVAAVPN